MSETDTDTAYHVVVNDEEQYSIWEADREPPAGWRTVGPAAGRPQCLARIAALWTDMRPASVRGER
ncbi:MULTISPECIES: MbtH family protein [Kitasatospora]|uniref:MbtH protein n=2 Tax=Kitasatospora TaxID=2063 RepID=A0ABT1JCF4_9ACTN|nr:MbtH family protein [Kitasatospora paracochleata]MCP2314381.1 MbtH protein [Kitasatospora paracochleata]